MNQADFKAIEQFDVIEFQRQTDLVPSIAAVDKDGDNAVLVGYVHTNNKGYWHTVTAQDVIRVVKKHHGESLDRQAIKKAIKVVMSALEKVWNML